MLRIPLGLRPLNFKVHAFKQRVDLDLYSLTETFIVTETLIVSALYGLRPLNFKVHAFTKRVDECERKRIGFGEDSNPPNQGRLR